jgi:hypothetical protein
MGFSGSCGPERRGRIFPIATRPIRPVIGAFSSGRATGRSSGYSTRWHLQRGQKGGSAVGKTKRGKGTKVMAVADRSGLPVAAWIQSASPAEVTLAEETLDHAFLDVAPDCLIGDKAYDSDPLVRPRTGARCAATSGAGRSSASSPGSTTSAG